MAYIEDRIIKLEKEVEDLKSGIKLNNADIFSRLQHISDRVFGVPKTGPAYINDEPQVQQTTDEFVRVVRCKDCKNYHKLGADFGGCDEWGEIYIKEDDYCSRGIK